MDFLEYVAAINLVLRGKLEDKLRWSFKVFDNDDNGQLDRNELRKIVKVKNSVFIMVQCHRKKLISEYGTAFLCNSGEQLCVNSLHLSSCSPCLSSTSSSCNMSRTL